MLLDPEQKPYNYQNYLDPQDLKTKTKPKTNQNNQTKQNQTTPQNKQTNKNPNNIKKRLN